MPTAEPPLRSSEPASQELRLAQLGLHDLDECVRWVLIQALDELFFREFVGDKDRLRPFSATEVRPGINQRGHNERNLAWNPFSAAQSAVPLTTEFAFSGLGVPGNDRNKERAVLDALFDLLVPIVPAFQVLLVEPHLQPGPYKSFIEA